MSSLSSIWIKKEVLETLLKTVTAKGEKGVNLDVSINDTVNDYGQNVSVYVNQTKEQREAKKPKYYVGNGKVFWTDGKIIVAPKEALNTPTQTQNNQVLNDANSDDLPF